MILLTDRQCRIFLKDMREFGYPDLTFEEVRKLANDIYEGKDIDHDVIGIMLEKQINEAERMIRERK